MVIAVMPPVLTLVVWYLSSICFSLILNIVENEKPDRFVTSLSRMKQEDALHYIDLRSVGNYYR